MAFFEVFKYMATKARTLFSEHGILLRPQARKRHGITDEQKKISEYYESNSRKQPGLKDFVSVRRTRRNEIKLQIRLLLINLRVNCWANIKSS